MAQQITSNTTSIVDMMTSTNNYVDKSSVVNFDDILNKTIDLKPSYELNMSKPTVETSKTLATPKNYDYSKQDVYTQKVEVAQSTNDNSFATVSKAEVADSSASVTNKNEVEVDVDVKENLENSVDTKTSEFTNTSKESDTQLESDNQAESDSAMNIDTKLESDVQTDSEVQDETLSYEKVQTIIDSLDYQSQSTIISQNKEFEISGSLTETTDEIENSDDVMSLIEIEDSDDVMNSIEIEDSDLKEIVDNFQMVDDIQDLSMPTIEESSVVNVAMNTTGIDSPVMVKVSEDSTVKATNQLLQTEVQDKEQQTNEITQELLDELNVELVESVENDTVYVSKNAENDLFIKLNDSYEIQVRESIEEYSETTEIQTMDEVVEDIETFAATKVVLNDDSVEDSEETKTEEFDNDLVDTDNYVDVDENITNEKNNQGLSEENTKANQSEDFFVNLKAEKNEMKEEMLTFKTNVDVAEPIESYEDSNNNLKTNRIDISIADAKHHSVEQATSPQQTITTKTGQVVSKENILSQIHDKLQMMNKISNSKMTMVLNPESLGKVTVQLSNTNNGIMAEMFVDSTEVKELLDRSLSSLRESLTSQGVSVDNVTVKLSESSNNTKMDYTEQENSDKHERNQQQNKNADKEEENKFAKLFSAFRDSENDESGAGEE